MRRLLHVALLALAGLFFFSPGCAKPKQVLHVLNWPDYLPAETLKNFEREFNCVVVVDNFASGDELLVKLRKSPSGFDLAFASDDVAPQLIESARVEKLNRDKIPNAKNIAKRYMGVAWDAKNEYSIPYMWGVTGIAFNRNDVKPDPDSWAVLWDPKYTNKMTMLDDRREAFVAAMFANGDDPRNPTSDSITRAKKKLLERRPLGYDSAPRQKLIDGDAHLSHSFNGDALMASDEKKEIGFVIPKEGATMWMDSMMIPTGAPNKDLAHAFIDFILRPGVSAEITNWGRFGNPNELAQQHIHKEIRENPLVYPPEDVIKRCFYLPAMSVQLRKEMEDGWAEIRKK